MIARTIPKIIPPTNEAPSNFLPLVGAGVVCFKGSSVNVDGGEPVVVVIVAIGAGFVVVGDIVLLDVELFVPAGSGDAGTSVSLEATVRVRDIK